MVDPSREIEAERRRDRSRRGRRCRRAPSALVQALPSRSRQTGRRSPPGSGKPGQNGVERHSHRCVCRSCQLPIRPAATARWPPRAPRCALPSPRAHLSSSEGYPCAACMSADSRRRLSPSTREARGHKLLADHMFGPHRREVRGIIRPTSHRRRGARQIAGHPARGAQHSKREAPQRPAEDRVGGQLQRPES